MFKIFQKEKHDNNYKLDKIKERNTLENSVMARESLGTAHLDFIHHDHIRKLQEKIRRC